MGSLAEANGSPSGYRAAEPVSGNLAPPPKKHQLQFVPTWFRSTIASAIDTAPFGAPERHDCPAKPPAGKKAAPVDAAIVGIVDEIDIQEI